MCITYTHECIFTENMYVPLVWSRHSNVHNHCSQLDWELYHRHGNPNFVGLQLGWAAWHRWNVLPPLCVHCHSLPLCATGAPRDKGTYTYSVWSYSLLFLHFTAVKTFEVKTSYVRTFNLLVSLLHELLTLHQTTFCCHCMNLYHITVVKLQKI